jgi:hypothetical protein
MPPLGARKKSSLHAGVNMSTVEKDEEREHRIMYEAIVDAYDAEEQALGWYYYLEGKIQFPFDARCAKERSLSPLRVDEVVEVIGMADEYDCLAEMFVIIEWNGRNFGVPLSQLEGIDVGDETKEAIEDWHYWIGRGYMLSG